MKISFIVLLLTFSFSSCKKEVSSHPLIGDWTLVKTFSMNGIDSSMELRKTTWRFESDGKLKIYKKGIRRSVSDWSVSSIKFLGQFIDSTNTYEQIIAPALQINNTKLLYSLTDETLKVGNSYLDGGDSYFQRN